MAAFAECYGFVFVCHEIKHANRKAGEERSFWTVETNFLPGRRFESLEDLNRQALEWATVRMKHRPASKTGLIPAKAFEHESSASGRPTRRAFCRTNRTSPCMTKRRRKTTPPTNQKGRTTMDEELQKIVKYLRLGGLLAHWDEWLTEARRGRFSHERLLKHVLEAEHRLKIEHARVGLFFTLMQKRHKTRTTLITSNLGFSEWGSLLKNNQLTGALLNRLTETSHVINMKNCHSLRPKLDESGESDAG